MPLENVSEADALKLPVEFEFEGKVYNIENPISFNTEARFAAWVFRQASDRADWLLKLYENTDGEEGISEYRHSEMIEQLNDRYFAGEFNWGTKTVHNMAFKVWEGIKQLLLFRMQKYDPKVKLDVIDRIFKSEKDKRRLYRAMNPGAESKKEEGEGESSEESQPEEV